MANSAKEQNSNKTDIQNKKSVPKSKMSPKGFFIHFGFGIVAGLIVLFEGFLLYSVMVIKSSGGGPSDAEFHARAATGALFLFLGAFFCGFGMGGGKPEQRVNYGCLTLLVLSLVCMILFSGIGILILSTSSIFYYDWGYMALTFGCGIMFGGISWMLISNKLFGEPVS